MSGVSEIFLRMRSVLIVKGLWLGNLGLLIFTIMLYNAPVCIKSYDIGFAINGGSELGFLSIR